MLLITQTTLFVYGFIAYIILMYLWMCKIVQQDLNDKYRRLLDIETQMTKGIISLSELALIANSTDTSLISEIDIPEGLIHWVDCMQRNFSLSPKKLWVYYKNIIQIIEPRLNRWEKEIKKRLKSS